MPIGSQELVVWQSTTLTYMVTCHACYWGG